MSAKYFIAGSLVAAAALSCSTAQADPLFAFLSPGQAQVAPQVQPQYAPDEQAAPDADAQLDPRLQRQIVSYASHEAPGTVIIDTPHTFLYYVLGNGKAIRYGIGVGRQGFTWAGVKQVARKAEWPDWYPPREMRYRDWRLPEKMTGGIKNPLGAMALYLGNSLYRIHGTNDPTSIGRAASSGCFRMLNEHVIDVYSKVPIGTWVIVQK